MKLIVLNLPRDLSEADLADMFNAHGKVDDCTLVMDGNTGTSKGFGFVEMADADAATAAVESLHGTQTGGLAVSLVSLAALVLSDRLTLAFNIYGAPAPRASG